MQMLERWVTRSDSWTTEDDRRLADIVLRHIKEGSTQLKAFVECADLLGRTPAACGYRWNGVVRKHYEMDIKQAKLIRKKNTSTGSFGTKRTVMPRTVAVPEQRQSYNMQPTIPTAPANSSRLGDAIRCIQSFETTYKDLQAKNSILEESISRLKDRIRQLEAENDRLREAPLEPISPVDQLTEDSKTLLSIMERARRMLGTEIEPVVEQPKVKFRMDRNGNLERIHL